MLRSRSLRTNQVAQHGQPEGQPEGQLHRARSDTGLASNRAISHTSTSVGPQSPRTAQFVRTSQTSRTLGAVDSATSVGAPASPVKAGGTRADQGLSSGQSAEPKPIDKKFQDPRNNRSGLALGTGNILMRHMQVWMREDDAPGHDLPTSKEYIARVLSSVSSVQCQCGTEAEAFVKGSAARIDNDQENPLLFMKAAKAAVCRIEQLLLSQHSDNIRIAAAGGPHAAQSRREAGLPIAPGGFDLEGTVQTAVEYACIRPLLGRIMSIARHAAGDKEVFLQTKIQKLKPKAFDDYLVGDGASEMKSKLRGRDWSPTIAHFDELSKPMLPCQALRILQRTVYSMQEIAASQPFPGRSGMPVHKLSQDFMTQILCFVIVQSSVEELRSIHLVMTELSPSSVVEPGTQTFHGSTTWCYRVFSNAMSVIEGMSVSLGMDNQDQALAASSASGVGGGGVGGGDVSIEVKSRKIRCSDTSRLQHMTNDMRWARSGWLTTRCLPV
eukprot:SAG31_NODE_2890_length_4946_cov_19.418816_4_plen_497_part_00